MFKKAFRLIFALFGMMLGLWVSQLILRNHPEVFASCSTWEVFLFHGCTILLFAIIFSFFYSILEGKNERTSTQIISDLVVRVSAEELVSGLVGLILGTVFAMMVSNIILGSNIIKQSYLNVAISVLLCVGFGYYGWGLGVRVGKAYKDKFSGLFGSDNKKKNKNQSAALPKIFDTSVIIDGRIQEILKTGFLEGDIIIPDFVLIELRHIADSADELKRSRGRRGLDILDAIQQEQGISICDTSSKKEINKISEVDLKLLQLASMLNGVVVTNDFNLNKVAKVQGIRVLNINELANTLKPIALPGEVMKVTPVKEGKTDDQSVAYLDDGTMIVVQGGRKLIGKTIDVTVTSVLQTSAGRMIFVKP